MSKLAVIRIRGKAKLKPDIRKTLALLRLKNVNNCTIVNDIASSKGMIKKVNDYVTWGEIDETMLSALKEKSGKENAKLFKLHPPKKGFERGGIKKNLKKGGALGYRGEKINNLIKKMI